MVSHLFCGAVIFFSKPNDKHLRCKGYTAWRRHTRPVFIDHVTTWLPIIAHTCIVPPMQYIDVDGMTFNSRWPPEWMTVMLDAHLTVGYGYSTCTTSFRLLFLV